MTELKSFYDGFADALRAPEPDAVPSSVAEGYAHRFAIYRNNVHRGLYDALGAAYPTVRKLVGDGFFDRLAQGFVQSETARAGSLALYGEGFAAFLAGHPIRESLPYLADIARLERARLEVSTSADAKPLVAGDLEGLEDQLEKMILRAHPACQVIASDSPIFAIWTAQNPVEGAQSGKTSIVQRPETVLVTRPYMQVDMHLLTVGQTVFFTALTQDGLDLGRACTEALQADANFDVIASFAEFLTMGAFDAHFDIPRGNGHDDE
ncbi:hypothetical protein HED22_00015 [Thalassospira sp. HF15]|uniref:HvfC/BufC N-terminal domain-containing protein n=1 Tax=Thalassospira sp. HF15 TaxID=2722755 RepID=UPI00143088FB|nr:DNA-binding domain-containing protein [Thalassospira sp. HF15]NIY74020.1 hypothetical protein [Thalassospira sp. HF15]